MSDSAKYLHGYDAAEEARLYEQGRFLEEKIYGFVDFSNSSRLLEVGCGVGAQSEILLRRFPGLSLSGIDIAQQQVQAATRKLQLNPSFHGRYDFQVMDAAHLQFPDATFDGAFFCWMLEHVPNPAAILAETRRVMKPGSPVYLTEVQNHSFFLHPFPSVVKTYWEKFNQLQIQMAGDPHVGARLGNYLADAGFRRIETFARMFYLDSRQPGLRQSMFAYWSDLLLSAAPGLLKAGMVTQEDVDLVKAEMTVLAGKPESVFFYTFIQASALA